MRNDSGMVSEEEYKEHMKKLVEFAELELKALQEQKAKIISRWQDIKKEMEREH